jgi:hypothetical protein
MLHVIAKDPFDVSCDPLSEPPPLVCSFYLARRDKSEKSAHHTEDERGNRRSIEHDSLLPKEISPHMMTVRIHQISAIGTHNDDDLTNVM